MSLIADIKALKRSSTGKIVKQRMAEFKKLGKSNENELFKELCFCLLTANYTAEGGIRVQKAIGTGFIELDKPKLVTALKQQKYRFPNVRAAYIVEARKHHKNLKDLIIATEERETRNWLSENVKGLGYKEASHFLRNIGYENVAIIDFHIVDILVKNKYIQSPKTLTKKKYLEIEQVLEKLAKETGTNLAELDLYLWYMETGKILK